jgi:aminoglycoside phosphotransferase family enzyme/predicted kinase
MELAELIEALSRPEAYPFPVQQIDVRHTHISVVFLAGSYAYKVKKPVDLGFLDFSTLDKRRHYCEEEVRLNRRLSPSVYLGVVPIVRTAKGIQLESVGEIVEWAVKMERLPEKATLAALIANDDQGGEQGLLAQTTALAKHVALFHARAETTPHISTFGRLEMVAQNAHENFDQAEPLVGVTLSRAVLNRLKDICDEALAHLGPLIESRAQCHVPRDTHGDLHLDHVYVFPDRSPPNDLVIVDCIEFNERFRYADPVADMAFLYMDFLFHGRGDLAEQFANEYSQAAGDQEERELLPFYAAYRAAVRGKVEGFELAEEEVPEPERVRALARARAHWLLALGLLEKPSQRPCLLLVAGLPGSGKSTLARGLSERSAFSLIRSDVVRKELAASLTLRASMQRTPTRSVSEGEIYSSDWTDRTYAECLDRAEKLLFQGKRVVIDATFREERKRGDFLELAARLAVPAAFLVCEANAEIIRLRLGQRKGDVSDADWSVYRKAVEQWEEAGPRTRQVLHVIRTQRTVQESLSQAMDVLRKLKLAE